MFYSANIAEYFTFYLPAVDVFTTISNFLHILGRALNLIIAVTVRRKYAQAHHMYICTLQSSLMKFFIRN